MIRRLMLLSLVLFMFIEWGPLTREREKYGIAKGNPFIREVVLTFDDGPRETGMQEIDAVLSSFDVKATFFLVGKFAERYSDITLMLSRQGYELANHTYTHPRLYQDHTAHIVRQAERCDEVLERLGIRKTRFLRPPGGHFNMEIFNAMRRMNLKLGLWSLNTADYTGRPPEEIYHLIAGSVRNGDIILMHSGMDNTVEALPAVIRELHRRGFTIIRLEDMWNEGRT
ncbi:MAG: polysaccharide deacetylase family protein [Synergistaceae bacterium]|nr:polysaccharide deacetylase family protein [Synergistaceae bacterium]